MTGSNSICQYHAWSHWEIYKEKCSQANLTLHHHAVPHDLWAEIMKKPKKKGKGGQQTLILPKVVGPKEYIQDDVLHAVAQFMVCDDQVCVDWIAKQKY